MKGLCLALVLLFTLGGCTGQETFETIMDAYDVPASAQMRQLLLDIPEDTDLETIESDRAQKLYLCDGFCMVVQTMQSGDLNRTLQDISGFSEEQLSPICTRQDDVKRYDWVCAASGEGAEQVCRGVVLDDGFYHYTVCLMGDAAVAGEMTEQWETILNSVRLSSIG